MQPLIVTAAIICRDGEILITRRPEGKRQGGLWEFPGGKLEGGESPAVCLCREIREELDLAIRVDALFDVVHHRYDWGAILLLAYRCTPLAATIRNLQVAEHRWVAPEALADFPFLAADLPLIARLRQPAAN